MAVRVPFVRWGIIRHDVDVCTKVDIYYLETAQGEKVVCVAAIPGEGNHMTHRPFDSFLQDYRVVLPF